MLLRHHICLQVGVVTTHGTENRSVLGLFGGCLCFGLGRGFWQKLLKVLQEIGSRAKELSNLGVHVVDGLAFSLVGLQNLEELLVDFWLIGESILM